ncbi:MAG: hypothetical protein OMM_01038 [Candidatus Magnetoglobus multicellularis str. Araruama]|uniref:Uncharacterized protein n=1 Tax=Candidatus Magnetoglobus multicellularis str. Araruama TaxID=890399 RepID=A0A1V1PEX2_9BACT|nr:MAG: hypothetical protein OMM_01038 [Candidatus Magnetoglobus multicellularis str. Araruama]
MGKSSPCIMSFASDQIKGLEYIYNQRTKLNIAAVNMSLSGGKPYAKACDNDPRNAIINQLYQAGIAVIASSGNSGYDHAIGAPACISHVISVGAVDNNDIIQSFSNSSDLLDFLAPGYAIQSSIPEHGFRRKTGTSMAAPHVTGAWAIMRSKYNNVSNDKILQLLKNNAPIIMDHRNSTPVSRIQIDWAASDIPILLPDKTIENQVDFHSWHYYRIVNQAAECQYTVRLHNLSDDADLYFRHTDIPTLDQWDIRPYKGTQCSESLQFLAENHDVWFVGVYGYRAAQYHLSLNSQPVYQLKPDSNSQQPIEKHAWHYYVTDVSRIKQIRVDSLKGDADLYCQIGQLPDKLNYFKKSNKNQRYPDICELQLSYTPKKLYVGIYGYQAGRYEIHAE